ncbi:MAG TPA: hypothetical protein VFF73_31070, partial [Planctomycetota bacterium]|nr:hypothetical protein [Planctomycetota bacterium]
PIHVGTQVASPLAIATFDGEVQACWNKLLPAAQRRIHDEVVAQLTSLAYVRHDLSLGISDVTAVTLQIQGAPGFDSAATNHLEAAVPLTGTWSLEVDLVVKVQVTVIAGTTWTVHVPVNVLVNDLRIVASVDIDDSDPTRPAFKSLAPPAVTFNLAINSPQPLAQYVLQFVSPVGDLLAQIAADVALELVSSSAGNLSGALPGPIPGDGAPPLVDSGAPTPFREIALNVDAKIRRDCLPHGGLHMAEMDVATPVESIATAFGPGGPGSQGNVVGYQGTGDSAIWTGHFLASQALRFGTTQDPDALEHVRWALVGIGNMLDVHGGSGLLARSAAPQGSLAGLQIVADGNAQQATINGQTWVYRQGTDGISRDQYSGVIFGLGLALDLVPDPQVHAAAALRTQEILDYLVAHDWYVDEDRPVLTGNGWPTMWLGVESQLFAYLLVGNRAAPGRYDAELARLSPLSELAWIDTWIGSFNLDHYYGNNLAHIAFYNYFRLETDPNRWADMMRAWRILRRYVGKHRNPHFDLIATTIDPTNKAALEGDAREVLRHCLERNHRSISLPVINLSGITYQTFSQPTIPIPGKPSVPKTVTYPTEPLDPTLLEAAGWFLWQKNPFDAAQPSSGDPFLEEPGLDFTMPYWMGAYHGAF